MIVKMKKRKEQLEKHISDCEAYIEKAPEGSLRVSCTKGDPSYFHVTKAKPRGVYLSRKDDRELISKLAGKEYCLNLIERCREEIELLDRLLTLESGDVLAKVHSEMHPRKREFIIPLEEALGDRLAEWLKDQDPPLEYGDDKVKYKRTNRGEIVRSFAEKEIADALYKANIPYKYEHHLDTVDHQKWYPDFTIWRPSTGEIIIWEHCGMMEKQAYVGDLMNKLRSYYRSDLYTGNGLILTFGDSYASIGKALINSIIEKVIL